MPVLNGAYTVPGGDRPLLILVQTSTPRQTPLAIIIHGISIIMTVLWSVMHAHSRNFQPPNAHADQPARISIIIHGCLCRSSITRRPRDREQWQNMALHSILTNVCWSTMNRINGSNPFRQPDTRVSTHHYESPRESWLRHAPGPCSTGLRFAERGSLMCSLLLLSYMPRLFALGRERFASYTYCVVVPPQCLASRNLVNCSSGVIVAAMADITTTLEHGSHRLGGRI